VPRLNWCRNEQTINNDNNKHTCEAKETGIGIMFLESRGTKLHRIALCLMPIQMEWNMETIMNLYVMISLTEHAERR